MISSFTTMALVHRFVILAHSRAPMSKEMLAIKEKLGMSVTQIFERNKEILHSVSLHSQEAIQAVLDAERPLC